MTATLQLKSITCLKQQETFGDELYVTFNGQKKSLPNMTTGRTRTLSAQFQFSGSSPLSLFENDGDHWYDRDDHIGTSSITESQASGGDFTIRFDGGGARYDLVVDVIAG